jgi:hypothetical protein
VLYWNTARIFRLSLIIGSLPGYHNGVFYDKAECRHGEKQTDWLQTAQAFLAALAQAEKSAATLRKYRRIF